MATKPPPSSAGNGSITIGYSSLVMTCCPYLIDEPNQPADVECPIAPRAGACAGRGYADGAR
jgi:hypothetical protein